MTKLTLALLTLTAFLYAVVLVILRKRLPDPQKARGWRRRFIIATVIFVGLLGSLLYRVYGRPERIVSPCYMAVMPEKEYMLKPPMVPADPVVALRLIWLMLDPEWEARFNARLHQTVKDEQMKDGTAVVLALAYKELAFHQSRSQANATCYRMNWTGSMQMRSREAIMQQLKLLRKARDENTLEEATVQKSLDALALELEMLMRLEPLTAQKPNIDWDARNKAVEELRRKYDNHTLQPVEISVDAAEWILRLEAIEFKAKPKEPAAYNSAEIDVSAPNLPPFIQFAPQQEAMARGVAEGWLSPELAARALLWMEKEEQKIKACYIDCYLVYINKYEGNPRLFARQRDNLEKFERKKVIAPESAEKVRASMEAEQESIEVLEE